MAAPDTSTTQSNYEDDCIDAALADFERRYPAFAATHAIDELRAKEYSRLDRTHQVYLDYTGGGLHADSQTRAHMELLTDHVYGNPHSNNPTSLAATELVESARDYVFEYFNASPEEYVVIFTPNTSGSLKLVGEAYPFEPGDNYVLTYDNHNSVNGIREYARAHGAAVTYLPVRVSDMRLDPEQVRKHLDQANPTGNNLFAFPAQSNFTGVQHSLEWIEEASGRGWDVLVDCAAYAPTNRLDLSKWKPDFVPLSFYKMFGYPTGVGALIAKRDKLQKMRRPWFAGGTISIVSVQGEGWHYLVDGEAGYEDGTVNYLSLPAIEIGLRHLSGVGVDNIHERVLALTGWLLDEMVALKHSNGAPVIHIYGPANTDSRGGTISFNFIDPDGVPVDFRHTERMSYEDNISLRTGCFCNPGAGEIAHNIKAEEMATVFDKDRPVSYMEFYEHLQKIGGKSASTIRVSPGIVTNFADVYSFMRFATRFRDRGASEYGEIQPAAMHHSIVREQS